MMKVYGITMGKERVIVAAKNQADAARLTRMSLYSFRMFASTTGNDLEVKTAMEAPGTVFTKPLHHGASFKAKEPRS